jgi:hypothetical protein
MVRSDDTMPRVRKGLVLLLLAACRAAPLDPGTVLAVRFPATPAKPGSGEPNVAVDARGRALLTWIEPEGRGHALRLSALEQGRWTPARTIASGERWFVNWADFPMLAVLRDGTLAAHWLEKSGPGAFAYDVKVTVSRDGAAWSAPVVPHRDGTQAEHGFVSIVPSGAGAVLLWLDGRDITSEGGATRGEMKLMAAPLAADGTVGAESVLDARVCECCQTSAAAVPGGVVAAYRDRSGDEVRDISFVRLDNGRWSGPAPLSKDGWTIPG